MRALDEHGGVLAESGTPTLPFRLQVAVPIEMRREPQRWYQKWWFWTLVGAAAVGAGAITYIETRPSPSNELVIPGRRRGAMSMLRIRRGILGLAGRRGGAPSAAVRRRTSPA